jgi:hypothetical protein
LDLGTFYKWAEIYVTGNPLPINFTIKKIIFCR